MKITMPVIDAVIVAAGRGKRLGAAAPKAFVKLAGKPLFVHSLLEFAGHWAISRIIVVVPAAMVKRARHLVARLPLKKEVLFVAGGEHRWQSVKNGVEASNAEWVLIHDSARPFITRSVIDAVLAARKKYDAVIAAIPEVDTVRKFLGDRAMETIDRNEIVRVQTPQLFMRKKLLAAFAHAASLSSPPTDEAVLHGTCGCSCGHRSGRSFEFQDHHQRRSCACRGAIKKMEKGHMRVHRMFVVAFITITSFGLWTTVSAMIPNIFYFTQDQDAASTPGKLIITYMPDLTETPQSGPYLTGAEISWINNHNGQTCNTGQMQHVSANNFKFTVDAADGDTIDYFFTQKWIGNPQNFYGWIPPHQCRNATDTKWFTYVMGKGFEQKPAWPIKVEGSSRFRNRHENEWRFDSYAGNYFVNTGFDYKFIDWGDSLLVFYFPNEPTNWANGRFFGMSGYELLCDHDTYADNRGSGDNVPPGGVFDGPTNVAGLGMTENPFQKDWTAKGYNLKWYVWMIRNLSYGQYIDFELSADRTLADGQLFYSEPQRYYTGLGRIDNKFQHPWAKPAAEASVNTIAFPDYAYTQAVQNTRPASSCLFMKGKAFFDTDWKTGKIYNYPVKFDCNGAPMSFPDTTHSPYFRQDASGPLYKATSCFGCHFQDGKGYPETGWGDNNDFSVATFVKLQVSDSNGAVRDHPVFGPSLQIKADSPDQPQGKCNVAWVDGPSGTYGDGTPYKLRRPVYSFSNLGYGVTSMDSMRISPRFIPHLSGLGLLEAIDENTILSFVNIPDKAGTGIVGKPQRVNDTFKGPNTLGRFGWKAGMASLKSEVYTRVASDLGISNGYFKDIVPPAATPDAPKIPDAFIDTLIMHVSLLAPPPRQMGKGYITFDSKIKNASQGRSHLGRSDIIQGRKRGRKIWKDCFRDTRQKTFLTGEMRSVPYPRDADRHRRAIRRA